MAFAVPKPEDRLAFADELAQIRAKDVKNQPSRHQLELEQHHLQTMPQNELEAYTNYK